MRIIPVLDLKGGVVVRGVAGRREEYRPIVSRLVASAEPAAVARAFRDRLGLTELYLADLDAIAGASPARGTYEEIQSLGCRLWVDAGVRNATDALELARAGVEKVIVGLETISGPDELEEICRQLDRNRVVFSLDLRDGRPLGNRSNWGEPDSDAIVARAAAAGVIYAIILDLARVGLKGGTGTEPICQRVMGAFPHMRIIAGGGVRSCGDLQALEQHGIYAVLLASALHEGAITREDVHNVGR